MMQPLNTNVLIIPDPEETTTASGIVLPDSGDISKPTAYGTVAAVPQGSTLSVGNHVLYAVYAPIEITIDGIPHVVVEEADIIALDKPSKK